MTSLQQVNFYQLVQAAMKVERLETKSKEKSQKKKFSKGASSSSGKRARDVQAGQYRVRLQEVEDREVQQYRVWVEVLQLDMEKSRSALIAIDGIRVFAGY